MQIQDNAQSQILINEFCIIIEFLPKYILEIYIRFIIRSYIEIFFVRVVTYLESTLINMYWNKNKILIDIKSGEIF